MRDTHRAEIERCATLCRRRLYALWRTLANFILWQHRHISPQGRGSRALPAAAVLPRISCIVIAQDGDMALLDMGAEYHCYTSDIT